MINILLFGKNGQVGWELQRSLSLLGNLIAIDRNSFEYCGDFSNPAGIENTVLRVHPDIIVNAVAYTKVDEAESNIELARLINTVSVERISKAAREIGSWIIHYSTDYVFPGTGDIPWKETDITAPLNVYGETKLAGEKVLQYNCTNYLIFRTSWVYSNKGSKNFVKKILLLAKKCKELSIVNDQFGSPTSAEILADCTAHTIRIALTKPSVAGLYHLVANGTTTWYDYAMLIFQEACKMGVNLTLTNLNAVPTSTYITLARRPSNSRMNTEKFKQTFNLTLPDWKIGVKRTLHELFMKNMIST